MARMGRPPRPAIDRFLERFVVDDATACWLWIAAVNPDGYSQFQEGPGRTKGEQRGHRFAYKHFVGPIPDGLVIDHLCRVRHCVNPDHLEVVTVRENLLRGEGWGARNARKTHCPRNHAFDDDNTYVDPAGSRRCRTCDNARRRVAA